MARYRCNSCGGEYPEQSTGGVPYFHACPPLSEAEALPAAVQAAARVLRDAGKPESDARAVIESAPEFAQVGTPRPDMRDENVVQDRFTRKVSIVAEGKGRTEV